MNVAVYSVFGQIYLVSTFFMQHMKFFNGLELLETNFYCDNPKHKLYSTIILPHLEWL
jgi:hypothetical protein